MMSRLDNAEFAAIKRLSQHKDFDALLAWSQRSLDEVKDSLITASAQQVPLLQGQAQAINEFLSTIQGFPAELRKFDGEESRKNTARPGSGLGDAP